MVTILEKCEDSYIDTTIEIYAKIEKPYGIVYKDDYYGDEGKFDVMVSGLSFESAIKILELVQQEAQNTLMWCAEIPHPWAWVG